MPAWRPKRSVLTDRILAEGQGSREEQGAGRGRYASSSLLPSGAVRASEGRIPAEIIPFPRRDMNFELNPLLYFTSEDEMADGLEKVAG